MVVLYIYTSLDICQTYRATLWSCFCNLKIKLRIYIINWAIAWHLEASSNLQTECLLHLFQTSLFIGSKSTKDEPNSCFVKSKYEEKVLRTFSINDKLTFYFSVAPWWAGPIGRDHPRTRWGRPCSSLSVGSAWDCVSTLYLAI